MSLDTGSIVSYIGWYMMSRIGRYMTINEGVLSDGNWELTSLISVSTSTRNRESTTIVVWSATECSGRY